MDPITRRGFGSILAGLLSASQVPVEFVRHRILRRPYKHSHTFDPYPYMLYDALFVQGTYQAALRVTAKYPGAEEPILQATVSPRDKERFMLLGVNNHRAELSLEVTIESSRPFKAEVAAKYMHPGFRREDGMIIYHDSFYKPRAESPGFGMAVAIHRKIYGPGKDVGYC